MPSFHTAWAHLGLLAFEIKRPLFRNPGGVEEYSPPVPELGDVGIVHPAIRIYLCYFQTIECAPVHTLGKYARGRLLGLVIPESG